MRLDGVIKIIQGREVMGPNLGAKKRKCRAMAKKVVSIKLMQYAGVEEGR